MPAHLLRRSSRDGAWRLLLVVVAWGFAAVPVAVLDLLSIPAVARETLESPWQLALVFAGLVGALLPVALAVGIGLAGVVAVFHALSRRARSLRILGPAELTAALAVLLALPVALWLGDFTLSGPAVRTMAWRPLFVAALAAAFASGVGAFVRLLLWRITSGRPAAAITAASLTLASGLVVLSRQAFPDEYVPLHALLGAGTLALVGLAVYDRIFRLAPSRRVVTVVAGAAATGLALLLLSALVLPNLHAVAWVVWGETAVARYATYEWSPNAAVNGLVSDDDNRWAKRPDTPRRSGLRRKRAAAEAPNVVLFFVDNVHRDHVGAYGYERHPTTPNIDALAAEGVVFERVMTPYPQTRNFSSALLLGRFVPSFMGHDPPTAYQRDALTHHFKARGYRIAVQSFFEDSSHHKFDIGDYGIDGFYPPEKKPLRQDMGKLHAFVEEHVKAAAAANQPVLVWLHIVRPHWDRDGGFNESGRFAFGDQLNDHYDSAIAASDAELPWLRRTLEQHLPERRTIWVAGSDHAPGLVRYRRPVATNLFHDKIDVPLIIAAPGFKARRVDTAVNAPLDLAATLLDLVGIEPPESYHGRSLVPAMLGQAMPDRPVLLRAGKRWEGVRYGKWKLLRRKKSVTLFDLESDPREKKNVASAEPDVLKLLVGELERLRGWESAYREGKREP